MKIVRYYTNLTSGAVLQRSGHRNLLVLSWSPWQANNWNPSAWHKPDHVVVSAYSKTLAVLIQIYVNVITQSLSTYWFTPHQNEKALREMQTLHTGCSKAEPKIFTPLQTPFPGAQDGQNLISWRWSLPLHTNQVWWGSSSSSSLRRSMPIIEHSRLHKLTPLWTILRTHPCCVKTNEDQWW